MGDDPPPPGPAAACLAEIQSWGPLHEPTPSETAARAAVVERMAALLRGASRREREASSSGVGGVALAQLLAQPHEKRPSRRAGSTAPPQLSALLPQLLHSSAAALSAKDTANGARLLQLSNRAARRLARSQSMAAGGSSGGSGSGSGAAVDLRHAICQACAALAAAVSRLDGRPPDPAAESALQAGWALLQSAAALGALGAAGVKQQRRALALAAVFGVGSAQAGANEAAAARLSAAAADILAAAAACGGGGTGGDSALERAAAAVDGCALRPGGVALLSAVLASEPLAAWDSLLLPTEQPSASGGVRGLAAEPQLAPALLLAAAGKLLAPPAAPAGDAAAAASLPRARGHPHHRRRSPDGAAAATTAGLLSPMRGFGSPSSSAGPGVTTSDASDDSSDDSEDGGAFMSLIFPDSERQASLRAPAPGDACAAAAAVAADEAAWHAAAAVLMQQAAGALQAASTGDAPHLPHSLLDAVAAVVGACLREGGQESGCLERLQAALATDAAAAAAAQPAAALRLARATLLRPAPAGGWAGGTPRQALLLGSRAVLSAAGRPWDPEAQGAFLGAACHHFGQGVEMALHAGFGGCGTPTNEAADSSGSSSSSGGGGDSKAALGWLLSPERLAPLLALALAAPLREQGAAAGRALSWLPAGAQLLRASSGFGPGGAAAAAQALAAMHAALMASGWLLQGAERPLAALRAQLSSSGVLAPAAAPRAAGADSGSSSGSDAGTSSDGEGLSDGESSGSGSDWWDGAAAGGGGWAQEGRSAGSEAAPRPVPPCVAAPLVAWLGRGSQPSGDAAARAGLALGAHVSQLLGGVSGLVACDAKGASSSHGGDAALWEAAAAAALGAGSSGSARPGQRQLAAAVDELLSSHLPRALAAAAAAAGPGQLAPPTATLYASCLLAGAQLLGLAASSPAPQQPEQPAEGFNRFGSLLHLAGLAAALPTPEWRPARGGAGGLAVATHFAGVAGGAQPPTADPAAAAAALGDAAQRLSLAGGPAALGPGAEGQRRAALALALPGICAGIESVAVTVEACAPTWAPQQQEAVLLAAAQLLPLLLRAHAAAADAAMAAAVPEPAADAALWVAGLSATAEDLASDMAPLAPGLGPLPSQLVCPPEWALPGGTAALEAARGGPLPLALLLLHASPPLLGPAAWAASSCQRAALRLLLVAWRLAGGGSSGGDGTSEVTAKLQSVLGDALTAGPSRPAMACWYASALAEWAATKVADGGQVPLFAAAEGDATAHVVKALAWALPLACTADGAASAVAAAARAVAAAALRALTAEAAADLGAVAAAMAAAGDEPTAAGARSLGGLVLEAAQVPGCERAALALLARLLPANSAADAPAAPEVPAAADALRRRVAALPQDRLGALIQRLLLSPDGEQNWAADARALLSRLLAPASAVASAASDGSGGPAGTRVALLRALLLGVVELGSTPAAAARVSPTAVRALLATLTQASAALGPAAVPPLLSAIERLADVAAAATPADSDGDHDGSAAAAPPAASWFLPLLRTIWRALGRSKHAQHGGGGRSARSSTAGRASSCGDGVAPIEGSPFAAGAGSGSGGDGPSQQQQQQRRRPHRQQWGDMPSDGGASEEAGEAEEESEAAGGHRGGAAGRYGLPSGVGEEKEEEDDEGEEEEEYEEEDYEDGDEEEDEEGGEAYGYAAAAHRRRSSHHAPHGEGEEEEGEEEEEEDVEMAEADGDDDDDWEDAFEAAAEAEVPAAAARAAPGAAAGLPPLLGHPLRRAPRRGRGRRAGSGDGGSIDEDAAAAEAFESLLDQLLDGTLPNLPPALAAAVAPGGAAVDAESIGAALEAAAAEAGDEGALARGVAAAIAEAVGLRRRGSGSDAGSGGGGPAAAVRRGAAASRLRIGGSAGAAGSGGRRRGLRCTYVLSGSSFMEQHWYHCYTCGLCESRGCCSLCARACHAGHDVVYSGRSRFFCDCGAGAGGGGAVRCRCVDEDAPASAGAGYAGGAAGAAAAGAGASDGRGAGPHGAKRKRREDEPGWGPGYPLAALAGFDPRLHRPSEADRPGSAPWEEPKEPEAPEAAGLEAALRAWLEQGGDAARERMLAFVLACLRLVSASARWLQARSRGAAWARPPQGAAAAVEAGTVAVAGGAEPRAALSVALPPPLPPLPASGAPAARPAGAAPLLRLHRIIRLGNLEPSTGAGGRGGGYPPPPPSAGRGAASAAADALPLGGGRSGCSVSGSVRPLLAVCRGRAVGIMDLTDHLASVTGGVTGAAQGASGSNGSAGASASSGAYAFIKRYAVQFEAVGVAFDALDGRHLLVWGLQQAEVWTIDVATGGVTDRLSLTLPGDDGGGAPLLLSAAWLPGKDTWVSVTGPFGVSFYDLATPGGAAAPAITVRPPGAAPLAAAVVVPSVAEAAGLSGAPLLAERLVCVLLTLDGQLLSAPLPPLSALEAARLARGNSGGSCAVEASPMALPSGAPAAAAGVSLHYSAASGLLLACVEGPRGGAAAGGGGAHQRQLLLRLDPSGSRLVEACEWEPWPADEADAAARSSAAAAGAGSGGANGGASGSPAGALAGVWEVPLLPPARAALGCPQLLVCSEAGSGGSGSAAAGAAAPCAAVVALAADAAAAAGPAALGRGWSCRAQALSLQRGGGDPAGLACLSVPATGQTVALLVTSTGNLLFYSTPAVPGLLPPPQPPAKAAAPSAASQRDAASGSGDASGSSPAAAAAYPFDEPERSEPVNDRIRVGGDVSHLPGGAAAAARSLFDRSDPESYYEAPSPGAARLTLRLPSDPGLAIVGVRVLVGASGGAYAPTRVAIGDGAAARSVRLAPRDASAPPGPSRRWFAVMLTPAEALASEVALSFGPAREAGLRVRIHQIDAFAQPRADVARRAAEAAAAAAAGGAGAAGASAAGAPGPAAAALGEAAASSAPLLAAPADDAAAQEERLSVSVRCAAAALAVLPAAPPAGAVAEAAQAVVWTLLCPLSPFALPYAPCRAVQRDAWGLLEAVAAPATPPGPRGTTPAERWADAARLGASAALLRQLARQHPPGRAAPWDDAHAFAFLHAVALAGAATAHGLDAAVAAALADRRARASLELEGPPGLPAAPGPAVATGPAGLPGAAAADGGCAAAGAVRCLPSVLAWLRAGSRAPFLPPHLIKPLGRALLQLLAAEAAAALQVTHDASQQPASEGAAKAALEWPSHVKSAGPAAEAAAALLLTPDPEAGAAAAEALPGVVKEWALPAGGEEGDARAAAAAPFVAALGSALLSARGAAGPQLLAALSAVVAAATELSHGGDTAAEEATSLVASHIAAAAAFELRSWRPDAPAADQERCLLQLLLLSRVAAAAGGRGRKHSAGGPDLASSLRRDALVAVHDVLTAALPAALGAASDTAPPAVHQQRSPAAPPPAGGWAGFRAPLQPLALRRARVAADGQSAGPQAGGSRGGSGGAGGGGSSAAAAWGLDSLSGGDGGSAAPEEGSPLVAPKAVAANWGRLSRAFESDIAAAAVRAAAALAGSAGLPAACGWSPLSRASPHASDPWEVLAAAAEPPPAGASRPVAASAAPLSRSGSLASNSGALWAPQHVPGAGGPAAPAASTGQAPAAAGSPESWAAALTSLIAGASLPSDARACAQQLLLSACGGSKDLSHDLRGSRALDRSWAAAARHAAASKAATAAGGEEAATWPADAALSTALGAVLEAANTRPRVWALLCVRDGGVLPSLLRTALRQRGPTELARRAVRLMRLALDPSVGSSSSSSSKGPRSKRRSGSSGGGGAAAAVAAAAPGGGAAAAARLDLSCFGLGAAVAAADGGGGGSPPLKSLESTPFAHFLASCALGWAADRARADAAAVVCALRRRLPAAERRAADWLLLSWLPRLAGYGAAARQLLDCLEGSLAPGGGSGRGPPLGADDPSAAADGAAALLAALQAALDARAAHPHADAYRALEASLDLAAPTPSSGDGGAAGDRGGRSGDRSTDGHDGLPHCLSLAAEDIAAAPPPSPALRSLDSAAAALRYTATGVMARLAGWQSVAGFALTVSNPSAACCVAAVRFYYCCDPLTELQQMVGVPLPPDGQAPSAHGPPPRWRLAAEARLAPLQTEASLTLALPVLASAVRFEFAAFHSSLHSVSSEVLTCPRCSQVVSDAHGVCSVCRENAHQCRQCRAINYEAPRGAFMCNECGYSRRGRFSLQLLTAAAGEHPDYHPADSAGRGAALARLDDEARDAARRAALLDSLSQSLIAAAAPTGRSSGSGGGGSGSSRAAAAAGAEGGDRWLRPALPAAAALYGRVRSAHADALRSARRHAGVQRAVLRSEARRVNGGAEAGAAPCGPMRAQLRAFHGGYGQAEFFACAAARLLAALADAPAPVGPAAAARLAAAGAAPVVLGALGALPAAAASPARRLLSALARSSGAARAALVPALEARLIAAVGVNGSSSSGSAAAAAAAEEAALLEAVVSTQLDGRDPSAPPPPGDSPLLPLVRVAEAAAAARGAAAAAVLGPCVRGIHRACKLGLHTHPATVPPPPPTAAAAQAPAPAAPPQQPPPVPEAAVVVEEPPAIYGGLSAEELERRKIAEYMASRQRQQQQQPGSRALSRAGSGGPHPRRQHPGKPAGGAAGALPAQSPRAPVAVPLPQAPLQQQPQPAAAQEPPPPPPPLSDRIGPLAQRALLDVGSKEARQQAAAALALMHPTRGALLAVLERRLHAACGVGKAAKQYFALLEDCLLDCGSSGGSAMSSPFPTASGGDPSAAAATAGGGGAGGAPAEASAAPPVAAPVLCGAAEAVARQRAAEAVGEELRALAERLLLQQGVEGAGLANAGPQGFTLGRLVQLLQGLLTPANASSGGSGGAAAAASAAGVPAAVARQLPGDQLRLLKAVLWSASSLEALSVGRTSATKAAARAMEQLLSDRWGASPASGQIVTGQTPAAGQTAESARWAVAKAAAELLESLQPAGAPRAAAAAATQQPAWREQLWGPLLARLATCVCPERREPTIMLQLMKAPSQQDFIPGSIPGGGLVSASDVGGPLMRDVKNFVCRKLQMEGLMEDDFGMELLVAGSIIDLSLPVAAVHARVWQGGAGGRGGARRGGSAMGVTFRLSGLDGDATEPVVKTLPAADADQDNPEERFAAAAVLAERSGAGLQLLLSLLSASATAAPARRALPQLLKLLAACCAVRRCRQGLLSAGALRALLHLVHSACKPLLAADDSGPAAAADAGGQGPVKLGGGWTEQQLLEVLGMLESLANESNPPQASTTTAAGTGASPSASKAAAAATPGTKAAATPAAAAAAAATAGEQDTAVDVCALARALTLMERHGLGACGAVLARLLTALARSDAAAQRGLLDYFAPALDLEALDAAAAALEAAGGAGAGAARAAFEAQKLHLQGLVKLTEALAGRGLAESASGSSSGGGGGGGAEAAAAESSAAAADAGECGFRQLVLARGIPDALASYLLGRFAAPDAPTSAGGASSAGGALSPPPEGASPSPSSGGGAAAPRGAVPIGRPVPGARASDASGAEDDEEAQWMAFGTSPTAESPSTPRLVQRFEDQQRRTPPPAAAAARTPPHLPRPPARRPSGSGGGGGGGAAGAAAAAPSSSSASGPRLLEAGGRAWQSAAALPGVPSALQLLTALARGHGGVAALLFARPGLLPLAHALEGVHGGRELAPLAEGLLDAIAAAGGHAAAEAVGSTRAAMRAAQRAVAARRREEMLAAMGMVQVPSGSGPGSSGARIAIAPSPGSVPAASPLAAELAALGEEDDEDEEEGEVCMVCREGYGDPPGPSLACATCAASFHPACLDKWFESSGRKACPQCRNTFRT